MVHAICRPSQQITTLDVLQGLVLLGLLIAQALGQLAIPPQGHLVRLAAHHPDQPMQFMVQLLVAGQFDRMGSFLFGLGFYRCFQQASLALAADRIACRLLNGLLEISLGLSLLHRSADLLVPYALLGFTLLYVRKQSVASLLSWIVGVALLAIGVPCVLALQHPAGLVLPYQGFSRYLSYELMMLGGVLVGKLGIDHRDPGLRVRLSLFQVGLLPTAFLLKGGWVVLTLGLAMLPQRVVVYQPALLALCGFLGPLLLTGVYVLDVGLNARLTPSGWARWIGQVGQMSVTNYVLQSIPCTLLLDGYEVTGQITFWGRASIVVGIYAFQLGFSRVWGKHYRLGPLEWFCHQWIYDKPGQSNSVTTTKL